MEYLSHLTMTCYRPVKLMFVHVPYADIYRIVPLLLALYTDPSLVTTVDIQYIVLFFAISQMALCEIFPYSFEKSPK
jgi:hypothetical protein